MPSDSPAYDSIYREAVTLADRARGWFDGPGQRWRAGLSPDDQAAVAIESLAITARLMAVMAWLLDPANGIRGTGALARPGQSLRPFVLAPTTDLRAGSPLDGQPAGEIARASRQLAARLFLMTESAAAAPPPQDLP